jgi:hypothetical protein
MDLIVPLRNWERAMLRDPPVYPAVGPERDQFLRFVASLLHDEGTILSVASRRTIARYARARVARLMQESDTATFMGRVLERSGVNSVVWEARVAIVAVRVTTTALLRAIRNELPYDLTGPAP